MLTESLKQTTPKSLRLILLQELLLLSQAQLALRLGVSQQWVHCHTQKNGPKTVQPSRLKRVAQGLGMTTLELAKIARRRTTKSF